MRRILLLLAVALAASAPASAKSLHWQSVDVTAKLEADGSLQVRERQAIVFDGDWNGGERTFNLRAGQELPYVELSRVDEHGNPVPMVSGNVDDVDHWERSSQTQVRWRARNASDPPFENALRTYDISYTLTGVLREVNGVYKLDHDFCFPDRKGEIERFTLHFELDPAWRGLQSPFELTKTNVPPGDGVVVHGELQYSGAVPPAAVLHPMSSALPWLFVAVLAAGIAFIVFDFRRGETAAGRFAPPMDLRDVDDEWLTEHVFLMPPEVVGAAWDESVGAAEVAAVLARMTWEKKLSSEVKDDELHMRLLVPRSELDGYEAELVSKFFFNSRTTTSTAAIKSHYESTGFDPGPIVEKGIEPQLAQLPSWKTKGGGARWGSSFLILLVAAGLLFFAGHAGGENDAALTLNTFWTGAVTALVVGIIAAANANALTALRGRFIAVGIFLLPLLIVTVRYCFKSPDYLVKPLTPLALCLWAAAVINLVIDCLKIRNAPEKIAFRRRLVAARDYFVQELQSESPRLRDEWYPYVLAFGLGDNVTRWFQSYGQSRSSGAFVSSGYSSSSSSSSSSSGPSWTGGGGAFGGAGASGGWAVAAASLGSGVSAPSSSSSGGGSSSSSGGSSGGGGGGGW